VLTVEFSQDQQDVLDEILAWRENHNRSPYLTLGGHAGTGKTTLISYLAGVWPQTAIVALCGKAAHVLRSRGVDAQTLHSLIYFPQKDAQKSFRFRKRISLEGVETIIVDEASMIDHVLFADLMSYGLPVLFVGDHGQLEPIGTNANLMASPTLRLEKIHRQAKGNPILRLATAFREDRPVRPWKDKNGRLEVLHRHEFPDRISSDVQILCGFNKTRNRVNAQVRRILGIDHTIVAPGERLICLQNHRRWNIFNGQQMKVLRIGHEGKQTIHLEIQTDDGRAFMLPCLRQQFGHDQVKGCRSKDVVLMD
jgi:exodeoxyribonuclease-5